MHNIKIGRRTIGEGYPVFIIAEMSANHNQDFDRAVEIVKAAKEAGADAVKLQTFTPDTHTIQSKKEYFRITGKTPWDDQTLYDLYSKAYMPWEWQPELKKIANELGIDLFSSAVDSSSVDFLEEMGVPAYKVASFEIVDLPLLDKIARLGKAIVLSTGMCTISEIEEAVLTIRNAGNDQIVLLKCTSGYPALPEEMNLKTIPHLSEAFGVPVGLSDHSFGISIPVAAAALGASVIEKHFTLSRSIPTLDKTFSLEPHEFREMVSSIRTIEKALGTVYYGVSEQESRNRIFRRSLFVVKDITAGERFTEENIRSIRPGHGLHPRHFHEVLGRSAKMDVEKGTPLTWDLVYGLKE